MSMFAGIRKWPIILAFAVGALLVVGSIMLDAGGRRQDIWPSVLLEIGVSIGLAGVVFLLERRFVLEVKANNQATEERVADLIGSQLNESGAELRIDIVPTATDRGQQPKMLVRITDPAGDFRTAWRVELTHPSGRVFSTNAFWPGGGRVFRARFPVEGSRAGLWKGVAIRNGTERHPFEAQISEVDGNV